MSASQNQTAYPLAWPNGWKRHSQREKAPFFSMVRGGFNDSRKYRRETSMQEATTQIERELRLMGVSSVVISTNVELRADGLPRGGRVAPMDPGAAIYFRFKGKDVVLACDKWRRVEDNLWAIAKDIEAQRGRARWGVGDLEQAFAGYLRLNAPGQSTAATWYSVLGVEGDCTFEVARASYRSRAMEAHPDQPGGSSEKMIQLNAAWDQARRTFGQ